MFQHVCMCVCATLGPPAIRFCAPTFWIVQFDNPQRVVAASEQVVVAVLLLYLSHASGVAAAVDGVVVVGVVVNLQSAVMRLINATVQCFHSKKYIDSVARQLPTLLVRLLLVLMWRGCGNLDLATAKRVCNCSRIL